MENFKVGDKVRVVPDSYTNIYKRSFLDSDCWRNSDPDLDEKLMLGGIYNIIDMHNNEKQIWYRLLKKCKNENVMKHLIKHEKDVRLCNYKVGDIVQYMPRNTVTLNELAGHENGYELSNKDKKYVIKMILNDYYIFLDYDLNNDWSTPFSWEDFRLIQ